MRQEKIKSRNGYIRRIASWKKECPEAELGEIAYMTGMQFQNEDIRAHVLAEIKKEAEEKLSPDARAARNSSANVWEKISIKNFEDFKKELIKQAKRHSDMELLEIADVLSQKFKDEKTKASVLEELRAEAEKYENTTDNKINQLRMALKEIWKTGSGLIYDVDDFRYELLRFRIQNPDASMDVFQNKVSKALRGARNADTGESIKEALSNVMNNYPDIKTASGAMEKIYKAAPKEEKNLVRRSLEFPAAFNAVMEDFCKKAAKPKIYKILGICASAIILIDLLIELKFTGRAYGSALKYGARAFFYLVTGGAVLAGSLGAGKSKRLSMVATGLLVILAFANILPSSGISGGLFLHETVDKLFGGKAAEMYFKIGIKNSLPLANASIPDLILYLIKGGAKFFFSRNIMWLWVVLTQPIAIALGMVSLVYTIRHYDD